MRSAGCVVVLLTVVVVGALDVVDTSTLSHTLSHAASAVERIASSNTKATGGSDALLHAMGQHADELAGVADATRRRVNSAVGAIQAVQRKGGRPSASLVHAYEESAQLAQLTHTAASAAASRARADYGPLRKLLPLTTLCVSSPSVSDSLSKGGSTTTTPKRYTYTLCPFANLSQVEVLPDEWVRAEARSKGQARGGEQESVALGVGPDGRVVGEGQEEEAGEERTPNRTLGSPTLLGMWQGWVPHTSLLAHFGSGASSPSGVPPGQESNVGHVGLTLPRASDGTDAALYYEGVDMCFSESMRAKRRTWVLLTCTPALLRPASGGGGTGGGDTGEASFPHGFTGPAVLDRQHPEGFATLLGASGWANASEGGEGAHGLPGPSLTQAVLRALHPDLPPRFLPRTMNALPAGGGEELRWLDLELAWGGGGGGAGRRVGPRLRAGSDDPVLLHVQEDGLCTYVLWLGTQAACTRRTAKALKALAEGERKRAPAPAAAAPPHA